MKKGKETGIVPIGNFQSKGSNKELDKILHDINEILYFFSTLYISNSTRDWILKEIENAGNSIKAVSVTVNSKQAERKAELLTKLRDIYATVKKYHDFDSMACNLEQERNMSSYLVALYLKDKKNGLNTEQKLEWIKKIKLFADHYPVGLSLKNVQDELLKDFIIYNSF